MEFCVLHNISEELIGNCVQRINIGKQEYKHMFIAQLT